MNRTAPSPYARKLGKLENRVRIHHGIHSGQKSTEGHSFLCLHSPRRPRSNSPLAEVNKLVESRGDDVVFFDGRNAFEAKIGRFKNAVVPDVTTSRDFVEEIESGKYDYLKDKPIVTYCTGGIRCEILSSVMVKRGFKEVYQIEGGIVRYGKKYGDDGLWEGSLYTFDARMAINFSDKTKVIGECEKCGAATKDFRNCSTASCHSLILLCDTCSKMPSNLSCTHENSEATSEFIG